MRGSPHHFLPSLLTVFGLLYDFGWEILIELISEYFAKITIVLTINTLNISFLH